jgi:SAM-dependent methyltransferase
MGISADFLALLCCPKRSCRGDLLAVGTDVNQKLVCSVCTEEYPIDTEDGIPVLYPNVRYSPQVFKRHWDLVDNAKSYAEKYNSYLNKQGTPWGLYTHVSELKIIDRLLAKAKMPTAGMTIIDAGCGNGRLLSYYGTAKTKIGIDTSLSLLKAAKRRDPSLLLVCAQLEDMPFKDAVADITVSIRVFQHLQVPEDAFSEMVRVTRPSGVVMLENYNKLNLKEIYKRIRMLPALDKRKPWGLAYDRYYSFREIQKWAKDTFVKPIGFAGTGWGFHFYILEVIRFRKWPDFIQKPVYALSLAMDNFFGALPFFRVTLEKIGFIGSVQKMPEQETLYNRIAAYFDKAMKWFAQRAAIRHEKAFTDRNYTLVGNDRQHLTAAIEWLSRAQDATPDGGVSRGNSLLPSWKTNTNGWQSSYPETTGYIIPTFVAASKFLNDAGLLQRAVRMGQWEMAIQFNDGAVHGGNLAQAPNKATFDTGQVIRGLWALYQETKNQDYLIAAKKAAHWLLLTEHNKEGHWTENNPAAANSHCTTFNIYAIAPIAEMAAQTQNQELLALADRAGKYVLGQQQGNGWINGCDFADQPHALLHPVAYTIDGLWDVGVALNSTEFRSAARRALDGVIARIDERGFLAGRLNPKWEGTVEWACLTGSAQIGVTCLKLYAATGEAQYYQAARKLANFLKVWQNNGSDCLAGGRGAVWGSAPISGGYAKYEAPNWAAKYLSDLLLGLEQAKPTT